MSTPLRISDEIMLRARLEAELTERSATSQIEHWVKLGMALEGVLSHPQSLELKRHGAIGVQEALAAARTGEGQERALSHLTKLAQPRYGVDPERPGSIIRVDPDGTRVRGRFIKRAFVPDEPSP